MTSSLKPYAVWRDPDGVIFASQYTPASDTWPYRRSTAQKVGEVMAVGLDDAVQRYRLTQGDWQVSKDWVVQSFQGTSHEPLGFAFVNLNGQFLHMLQLRAKQLQDSPLVSPFYSGGVMAENFPPVGSAILRFRAPQQRVRFNDQPHANVGHWEMALREGEYLVRFVGRNELSTVAMPVQLMVEMFAHQPATEVRTYAVDQPALLKSMNAALAERRSHLDRDRDHLTLMAAALSENNETAVDAQTTTSPAPSGA